VIHTELRLLYWKKLIKIVRTKMKLILLLPISLCFLFPIKTQALKTYEVNSVCESFAAGKIDALKTLDALGLNIYDYSIGVNNTARLFCA